MTFLKLLALACLPLSCSAARGTVLQAAAAAHQQGAGNLASDVARAQELLDAGKNADAEGVLADILKRDPGSVPPNNLLGGLLLKEHRFGEAEGHFEAALESDLHDPTARRGQHDAAIAEALKLRNEGNGRAALLVLERAATYLPDDATLLTDLGIEADALEDYPRAIAALQAALRQKPDDPTALYALARAELDHGDSPRAESLFHQYLALRPDDSSAHYGLGHLLQMQQRTDEAAAEFHRSIELKPVQTESYFQLGQMALDAHQDADARAMFQKTLSRLPTHGGALTGLGILDYRAKQYSVARESLERATASSPDYEPAHYYLGLTLARLGDKAASAQELAIAADLARKQQDKSKPIGEAGP